MKWYEDYNKVLKAFELYGEIMDETVFFFKGEPSDSEHYLGCLYQFDNPYWAGYCDIEDGYDCKTAKELFEAKIYDGKSLKDRWNEVTIVSICGLNVNEDNGVGIDCGRIIFNSNIYRVGNNK